MPQEKWCPICKTSKDIKYFGKRSGKLKHLYRSACNSCITERQLEYRKNHLEQVKEKDRKYGLENREKKTQYLKKWRKQNRERVLREKRERYATDLNHRLRMQLKNRLNGALKKNSKSGKTIDLLGCSIEQFKKYLENRFYGGMTWIDLMQGRVELDHILPCSLFDLRYSWEQKVCFHYTNLQPLWEKDNQRKSNRIETRGVGYSQAIA